MAKRNIELSDEDKEFLKKTEKSLNESDERVKQMSTEDKNKLKDKYRNLHDKMNS